jgi:hypothetical protein
LGVSTNFLDPISAFSTDASGCPSDSYAATPSQAGNFTEAACS